MEATIDVKEQTELATRFGFLLNEEPKHGVVHDYEINKIWRERVGHQIDLMLSTNQQSERRIISVPDLYISWSVFDLPTQFQPPIPLQTCHMLCVSYMGYARSLMESIGHSFFTDDQWRLCIFSAMLLPFRDIRFTGRFGIQVPVVRSICKYHLNMLWSNAGEVVDIHMVLHRLISLIPYLTSDYESRYIEVSWMDTSHIASPSKLRVLTGLVLRQAREPWRVALVLSVLIYPAEVSCFIESAPSELAKRRELFKRVENEILKLGLENEWKSGLLVGSDIIDILDEKTSEEVVEAWFQKVLVWQLAHPSGTKDECIEWIRETQKTSGAK